MKKNYVLRSIVIFIVFLFLGINSTHATRYYVSKSGDNTSGLSWTSSFNELQTALDNVIIGDEIVVAKGIYTPSVSTRTDAFYIKARVTILGGFSGTEIITQETIDNRDFESNETILSGDLLGNDDSYIISDNSYSVVIFDVSMGAMSNTTVLDGFTISGGNANGSSSKSAWGAGIYMKNGGSRDCNPLLKNLIIKNNKAKLGAGLYIDGTEGASAQISPTLENVIFDSNYAYNGGGGAIYMSAAPDSPVDPVLKEVIFINNEATGAGGAVFLSGGYISKPGTVTSTFSNVTFYGNSCGSNNGTAIYIHGQDGLANPTFNNVIFYGNEETQIYRSALSGGSTNPSFNNCLITGSPSSSWNTALGNDSGGNIDGDPLLADPDDGNVDVIEGSPVLNVGDATYGVNIGYYQGVGITEPNITLVESITDFGVTEVGNSSTEQTFTISGTDLLNTVTVQPPTGFEVSLSSGTGYFDHLNLFPISGTIATTIIYIRFKPTTTGDHNGNVTVNTPGTAKQQFDVTAYAGGSPEISVIDNQTACFGAAKNVAFIVSDDDLSNISFDISITDESVLPKVNTEITGSNGNYNLAMEAIKVGVTTVTLTVIDGALNETSKSFDLTVNSSPDLTIDFTQRVCNGDPAEFMLSSSGGTGIINYNVNNLGYTSQVYYGSLADGNYEIVAKDESGCTDTSEIFTVSNPTYLIGSVEVVKEVTCADDEDATIRVDGSGGWGSYEYSINGIDFQTETDFTNLGSGEYQITVNDNEGCSQIVYANIMNPDVLTIDYITIDDNNSINIVAYGGWSPLTYALNDGSYQAESYFNNLTAGAYTAYVKDKEGCTINDVVNVTSTGIRDVLDINLNIYPNPTSDYISFDSGQLPEEIEEIQIYNLSGQLQIILDKDQSISNRIDVSNLNQGTYILVLKLKSNKMIFEKIIIN